MKNGIIEYNSGDKTYYAAAVSFKSAPDYMDEEFYNTVSTIQCEMICMNAFRPWRPSDIDALIRQHKSTVTEENEDSTFEQIYEAQSSVDENITGAQTLVDYYPLFILFGYNIDELNQNISEFKKICASFGVAPVVESFASKISFFAQIPGFDIFPRIFKMLSKTAAVSIPLSTMPRGVANSDWGPGPLVVFPTAQGTPYQFQFHISDKPAAVGHTMTIGPTGGGKTTLFSFLIAQSLRHQKLKAFFFDRNKGAEIFTLSVGGKYITMNGKEKDASRNSVAGVQIGKPFVYDLCLVRLIHQPVKAVNIHNDKLSVTVLSYENRRLCRLTKIFYFNCIFKISHRNDMHRITLLFVTILYI